MKYLISALIGGMKTRIASDDLEVAKHQADRWFSTPDVTDVTLTEPFGVIVTYQDGRRHAEYCDTYQRAVEAAKSFQGVIDNREINRHPAVSVEAIGLRPRAKQAATAEDIPVGAWLSAALSDPATCPSMKYDINLWFDSKEWP